MEAVYSAVQSRKFYPFAVLISKTSTAEFLPLYKIILQHFLMAVNVRGWHWQPCCCSITIDVRLKGKKKAKESVRIELPHTKLTEDSNAMKSITQNKRYLPHEMSTKINSVKLYRQTGDIDFVVRRYHISKASLMRWNKQYDGTRESLLPKSHRPHSQHPNAHTEEELKWIRNYHRRNPNISV